MLLLLLLLLFWLSSRVAGSVGTCQCTCGSSSMEGAVKAGGRTPPPQHPLTLSSHLPVAAQAGHVGATETQWEKNKKGAMKTIEKD